MPCPAWSHAAIRFGPESLSTRLPQTNRTDLIAPLSRAVKMRSFICCHDRPAPPSVVGSSKVKATSGLEFSAPNIGHCNKGAATAVSLKKVLRSMPFNLPRRGCRVHRCGRSLRNQNDLPAESTFFAKVDALPECPATSLCEQSELRIHGERLRRPVGRVVMTT